MQLAQLLKLIPALSDDEEVWALEPNTSTELKREEQEQTRQKEERRREEELCMPRGTEEKDGQRERNLDV